MDSQNLLMPTLAEHAPTDHTEEWPINPGSESDSASSTFEGPEWLPDLVENFPDPDKTSPDPQFNPVHFAPDDQSRPDELLGGVHNTVQAAVSSAVGAAAGKLAVTVASGTAVATSHAVQKSDSHVPGEGRGKKRRARTQTRLEQNAKAQRRYR